ncbi:MAG: serine/threonine protein kinase, partial [Deltaproteobacteria bacterium]|nr:serine/threonine protein kinase [Deltaproteobacteria bacterium]
MSEQFGKYQLERKLAVGGMAEIFLATHVGPEGFKKHVAIKRILPHLSENHDFVTMFLDEARLVARFNHPNIVQIFELGEVDGQYYLSMEYVPGANLSRVLKACKSNDTPLPLEYGAKIVSFACVGLDYAHNFTDADGTPLNLIHRDVSPQNLMLSYDGVVKVLDFGIAKAAGNIYHTRTTSLKGKVQYMSPEQITKKVQLDHRSDIFSLGIVLFEIATGQRPYEGSTELELMMSIVQKDALDPREISDVPDDMAEIINTALSRDRERRYPSCRQLRADIEHFLADRRCMVDGYALSDFLQALVPRGESVVGYSSPTPSRPSLREEAGERSAGPGLDSSRPSPARGRRRAEPEEVPTLLTPSGVHLIDERVEDEAEEVADDAPRTARFVHETALRRQPTVREPRRALPPEKEPRRQLAWIGGGLGLLIVLGLAGGYLLFGQHAAPEMEPGGPALPSFSADGGPGERGADGGPAVRLSGSTGASGTGASGTGTSGTGTSGTGTSGTGTSGTGASGTGTSGTGTSGAGASGTGASGTGASGTGTSGTGASGTGASGTGTSGTGTGASGTG